MHSRYSSHASRARIPCKKYHAGHMRAHDQPDTCLELLGAPISSSTRSPSSRPRASSTDGHHHRRRSCHDRPRHRRDDVVLIIAAAVAVFTIVAVVAEGNLSSPTSEYRRNVHLHHRLNCTITAITDAITDAAIARAAATRIMSFARQVAGGRVGCCAGIGDDDFKLAKVDCTA